MTERDENRGQRKKGQNPLLTGAAQEASKSSEVHRSKLMFRSLTLSFRQRKSHPTVLRNKVRVLEAQTITMTTGKATIGCAKRQETREKDEEPGKKRERRKMMPTSKEIVFAFLNGKQQNRLDVKYNK